MNSAEYWAGFFDGEGCIGLYRQPRRPSSFSLNVKVTNTNRSILRQLQEQWGGGVVYRAESAQWTLTGVRARPFLEAIAPYAHIKREQVLVALQYLEERPSRVTGPRGYTPLEVSQRERFRDTLETLKRQDYADGEA